MGALMAAARLVLAELNGQSVQYELNSTVLHQVIEHLYGMDPRRWTEQ